MIWASSIPAMKNRSAGLAVSRFASFYHAEPSYSVADTSRSGFLEQLEAKQIQAYNRHLPTHLKSQRTVGNKMIQALMKKGDASDLSQAVTLIRQYYIGTLRLTHTEEQDLNLGLKHVEQQIQNLTPWRLHIFNPAHRALVLLMQYLEQK